MVQGKINRGRHTDHPDGHHSIQTKQCPPPPSPMFYRPDALPAAQPTVSKHWRQKHWRHYLTAITQSQKAIVDIKLCPQFWPLTSHFHY